MDEISISAPTRVAELKDGEIKVYQIIPEDYGMTRSSNESLRVMDAQQSLQLMLKVFDNHPVPARDIVALNAGAAIYASGLADNLADGVQTALRVIASGKAKAIFDAFIAFTVKHGGDSR